MRLVTFEIKTDIGVVQRVGAYLNKDIIDLQFAYATYLMEKTEIERAYELATVIIPQDMLEFIKNGAAGRVAAEKALQHVKTKQSIVQNCFGANGEKLIYKETDVRLRAPIPKPVLLRDTSSFEQHMTNAMKALNRPIPELWYEIPSHFMTTHTNVAGPDDPIIWPSYTEKLDYELEFAVCIGKKGMNIPKERVNEYIAGYTIYNDVTGIDILQKEMGLGVGPAKGKNFKNSNILGPCLVTPDEFNPDNAEMEARVNGEVWSRGNSSDMYYKFADLISYISKDEPLYPGEFIGSGTCANGCGLDLNRWIKPGDIVELEVKGIGILKNSVKRGKCI